MILTLAMMVLFVLLAIGTPVGFAMAGSGVLDSTWSAACRCCPASCRPRRFRR